MAGTQTFHCLRCQGTHHEVGEARIVGGFWSKVFDIQGRKFTTVTCTRCKHTEFFAEDRSVMSNVFDFLVGG